MQPTDHSQALTKFFDRLWRQYQEITPQARAIHQLFADTDAAVVNDHVAFRTFADSPISLEALEPELLKLGFYVHDEYRFEQKKLYARSYNHKQTATKVFLSELLWQQLPEKAEEIIQRLITKIKEPINLAMGRPWPRVCYDDYLSLQAHSEYAAWLSVWGLRANHFTIDVNALKEHNHLTDVVEVLQAQGYVLNSEGGVIKGCEAVGLIQASTLADKVEVVFANGISHPISSCYYEFAQRFSLARQEGEASGQLYQGFVTASADKIFESTHIIDPHKVAKEQKH